MRSTTIRSFIVIASVLIAAIIGLQVHWLNKTYSYEGNEFNVSVVKSIRGIYEDMQLVREPGNRLSSLIEHPDRNTFLFQVDTIPPKDSLLHYLRNEFDDFKIYTACKLALYDNMKHQFRYEEFLTGAVSDEPEGTRIDLPMRERSFPYICLYFPDRDNYIMHQMKRWILTSALLLLLLVGFAASLYYFFKQKFLVEIQKDFINNVTHEFSTPLSVIELSVEGLERPGMAAQPEKYGKYVSSIKYQLDYLKGHISNLINTVVAGHYQMRFRQTRVAPNELLRRAALQLDPLLKKKKGEIQLDLESGGQFIVADEENLYLALFNIISNAIKYADQPVVQIRSFRRDDRYVICIRDNGIGIDPSEQQKIFRKFYRSQKGNVHSTKGLGLGLYFTKKVIDGHHGTILVKSTPGAGTEFSIEIPVNDN